MIAPERTLEGRRLLLVEDDYLIGAAVARSLENVGAIVVGPSGTIENALALLKDHGPVDAAVLDINLGDRTVYALADVLRDRQIPFVFATGYDEWVVADPHAGVPRLEKPVNITDLTDVLVELLLSAT
jgi:CheY-like chemotaxis protein